MKGWNHDPEAAAKMALALAECPEERRAGTIAFVVKLWLERWAEFLAKHGAAMAKPPEGSDPK